MGNTREGEHRESEQSLCRQANSIPATENGECGIQPSDVVPTSRSIFYLI